MQKKMTKKIVIMRGLPGSGKSTYVVQKIAALAKARIRSTAISADDYFTRDGKYTFDPTKIAEAHADCLRRFITHVAVFSSIDVLFVDNTNTTVAEIAPYAAIAQAYGWDLKIVTIVAAPADVAPRNVHGVPLDVVKKMAISLARSAPDLPSYWLKQVTILSAKGLKALEAK